MQDMELRFDERDEMTLALDDDVGMTLELDRASGGTSDYERLVNKPSIEGVTLMKDKTFEQLGLSAMTPQEIDDMLFGL